MNERVLDPWHCTLDDFASADAPMRRCLDLARAAAQTELPVVRPENRTIAPARRVVAFSRGRLIAELTDATGLEYDLPSAARGQMAKKGT